MRYLFAAFCFFALSACMSYGTKVDQEKVAQFVKGKTTYAEVVRQLGKPNQSTINSDGVRTISYTYQQSQMSASSFIPFVGLFVGGAESENTTVVMNFDKNSVLTDYTATEGGMDMGTGVTSGRKQ
ncbi:MAG: hypothetical protein Q7R68_01920 [Nitrospirales bacterium]|nr:hypothetical protein [Nitrospirales bacterium]